MSIAQYMCNTLSSQPSHVKALGAKPKTPLQRGKESLANIVHPHTMANCCYGFHKKQSHLLGFSRLEGVLIRSVGKHMERQKIKIKCNWKRKLEWKLETEMGTKTHQSLVQCLKSRIVCFVIALVFYLAVFI